MKDSKEILEAVSRGEISKEEAEKALVDLGCHPLHAAELVYLSTGGDDVVDVKSE